MVQEVILCGLKCQVPLSPEDTIHVEKISRGLSALRDRMRGPTAALFVPKDGLEALEALHSLTVCLLDASRAAAGRGSRTPTK